MPASTKPDRKPAALMISPEAPYPLNGGGALRTASLLHYLGERYTLDLVVFQHAGQRITEFLPPGLVRDVFPIPLRVHRNDVASRALRNGLRVLKGSPPLVDRFSGYDAEIASQLTARHYDLAVLEHFWSASYLPLARRFATRTVLNLHNVESVWHTSCADASSFPHSLMHACFARAARHQEQRWLSGCHLALTTSEDDARRVRQLSPGLDVSVYPNAIPWRPLASAPAEHSIAFSGNMEYEPNRTGLKLFVAEIWPILRQRFPQLIFRVIGKNAHAIADEVRGQERIECTGAVEDPFPHLAKAQVCIAPLRSGSGTRLKIIDAWAAGRPVVSTRIGAEGLGAEDGTSILLADDPARFAASVARLLDDEPLRIRIAGEGRALYERNFTWDASWRALSGRL